MKHSGITLIRRRALYVGLTSLLLAALLIAPMLKLSQAQTADDKEQDGATISFAASTVAPNAPLTGFPIPTANSGPANITTGVDGTFYFTETNANKIGQITKQGVIKEFPVPTANSQPFDITAHRDFSIWFTERGANKIGRMTLDGTITEFTIPTLNSQPFGVASGSDGALWFTENVGNKIGRITTEGVITEFTIPTANSNPWYITSGPDGNMWFTERTASKIGRITPAGVITEFSTLIPNSAPEDICANLDGRLWFTQRNTEQIGIITTAGVRTNITLFAGSDPAQITATTEGSIFVTEQAAGKFLKITPDSQIGLSEGDDEIIAQSSGNLPGRQIGFEETILPIGSRPGGITFLEDKNGPTGYLVGIEEGSGNIDIIQPPIIPLVDFTKTGADSVSVGEDLTYTLTVKNNSSIPITFTITDIIQTNDDTRKVDGVTQDDWVLAKIQPPGFLTAHSVTNYTVLGGEQRQIQYIVKAKIAGKIDNGAILNLVEGSKVISRLVFTTIRAVASGPVITSVEKEEKNLIVKGDFGSSSLDGAIILVDLEPQPTKIDRGSANTLIGKKSGKKVKPGETIKVQVLLADGKITPEFTYKRPN